MLFAPELPKLPKLLELLMVFARIVDGVNNHYIQQSKFYGPRAVEVKSRPTKGLEGLKTSVARYWFGKGITGTRAPVASDCALATGCIAINSL
jgi:hypothetical protein